MGVMVPGEARKQSLDLFTTIGAWSVLLLKTTDEPVVGWDWDDINLGTHAAEATWTGYSRKTPVFPASTLNGSNKAVSQGSTCVFDNTSGADEDFEGWALTQESSGVTRVIIWEKFAGGARPIADGGNAAINPLLTLTQG